MNENEKERLDTLLDMRAKLESYGKSLTRKKRIELEELLQLKYNGAELSKGNDYGTKKI